MIGPVDSEIIGLIEIVKKETAAEHIASQSIPTTKSQTDRTSAPISQYLVKPVRLALRAQCIS